MLDEAAMKFLEGRRLDIELAVRMGLYSERGLGTKDSVLVFPYLENESVVNAKYRQLPKERFWQRKNAKKTFWNVDCLDDPACQDGRLPVVVTEGEFDALAAIQCGFPLVVSVPDGAPPGSKHDENESGAITQDGKYAFIWNAREKLAKVRRFVLAVDGDAPGQRLQRDLIRLLGASRCSFVEYPAGCKDLNDVLIKEGPEAVSYLLNGAKPCPVKGLYKFSDYPDEGSLQTFQTGWALLDQHCKLFFDELVVVTGIPQHGKSTVVTNLLVNMAMMHGLRSVIFTPEMRVVPVVRDRMLSMRIGKHHSQATDEDHAWIEDMFSFIGADPSNNRDEDAFDLEWILQRARESVQRDGARILLIDPWNEIEHARRKGESMHDYIGWALRELKRFARLHHMIVIVVAHPTKMLKIKDGTFEVPSLYDISDSSHYYNKCDHGIIIHRDFVARTTTVNVAKSRFHEAGEPGRITMRLDPVNSRYVPLDTMG